MGNIARFFSLFLTFNLLFLTLPSSKLSASSTNFEVGSAVISGDVSCERSINLPPTPVGTTTIALTGLMRGAWGCVKGIFKGAWASSGGAVASIGKCFWSPIECAMKAKEGFDNTVKFFSNITTKISEISGLLSALPAEALSELICTIIGGVGMAVLIAVLTGGAGAGKVAQTIAAIVSKLGLLGRLASYAYLPISMISKFSQNGLNSILNLIRRGKSDQVRRTLGRVCTL